MTDCIFCKMATGEIKTDVVYEDEDILAFRDIAPKANVHVLIIPKKHLTCLAEAAEEDLVLLGKIQLVAKGLAEKLGVAESGYRIVTNARADSGQEVPHLHYHLLGGNKLGPHW